MLRKGNWQPPEFIDSADSPPDYLARIDNLSGCTKQIQHDLQHYNIRMVEGSPEKACCRLRLIRGLKKLSSDPYCHHCYQFLLYLPQLGWSILTSA